MEAIADRDPVVFATDHSRLPPAFSESDADNHMAANRAALSVHRRLVTSVPHLVCSRSLAGRPICEKSPGVMAHPAHGLHETGPTYI